MDVIIYPCWDLSQSVLVKGPQPFTADLFCRKMIWGYILQHFCLYVMNADYQNSHRSISNTYIFNVK